MRGGIPAAICVLTVCAGGSAACARVSVQTALPEEGANEVARALLQAGIPAEKSASPGEEGRFAVEVPAADAARAFDVLRSAGLPRAEARGFAELYAGDRLVPTASEDRARLQAAMVGELSRSIESVEGVLSARVHLSLPERDPLADGAGAEPVRASVLIRHGALAPPLDEGSVRRLVAGGVPGLTAENVAVVAVRHAPAASSTAQELPVVLGVRVDPSSAGTLRAMLGGMLAVSILLSAAVVGMVLRRRRADADRPDRPDREGK